MSFELEEDKEVADYRGRCPKCRNVLTFWHEWFCPDCDRKFTLWCPQCLRHRTLKT